MSKIKFTTTIDIELLKVLKIEAVKQGKNVNELIEELIKSTYCK